MTNRTVNVQQRYMENFDMKVRPVPIYNRGEHVDVQDDSSKRNDDIP